MNIVKRRRPDYHFVQNKYLQNNLFPLCAFQTKHILQRSLNIKSKHFKTYPRLPSQKSQDFAHFKSNLNLNFVSISLQRTKRCEIRTLP